MEEESEGVYGYTSPAWEWLLRRFLAEEKDNDTVKSQWWLDDFCLLWWGKPLLLQWLIRFATRTCNLWAYSHVWTDPRSAPQVGARCRHGTGQKLRTRLTTPLFDWQVNWYSSPHKAGRISIDQSLNKYVNYVICTTTKHRLWAFELWSIHFHPFSLFMN